LEVQYEPKANVALGILSPKFGENALEKCPADDAIFVVGGSGFNLSRFDGQSNDRAMA